MLQNTKICRGGDIRAFAFYSFALTPYQVAIISKAMALLPAIPRWWFPVALALMGALLAVGALLGR